MVVDGIKITLVLKNGIQVFLEVFESEIFIQLLQLSLELFAKFTISLVFTFQKILNLLKIHHLFIVISFKLIVDRWLRSLLFNKLLVDVLTFGNLHLS